MKSRLQKPVSILLILCLCALPPFTALAETGSSGDISTAAAGTETAGQPEAPLTEPAEASAGEQPEGPEEEPEEAPAGEPVKGSTRISEAERLEPSLPEASASGPTEAMA